MYKKSSDYYAYTQTAKSLVYKVYERGNISETISVIDQNLQEILESEKVSN